MNKSWVLEYHIEGGIHYRQSTGSGSWSFLTFLPYAFQHPVFGWRRMAHDPTAPIRECYRIRNTRTGETITVDEVLDLVRR